MKWIHSLLTGEPPTKYYTNCIKLLRFVYLAQTGGSLKRSLGMARRSLCKAQNLITIGINPYLAPSFTGGLNTAGYQVASNRSVLRLQ